MKALFAKVKEAIQAPGKRRESILGLQRLMEKAVADGHVSDLECTELNNYVFEFDLPPEEVQKVVDQVYQMVAARYMTDRRVTAIEERSLEDVGLALNVSPAAIAVTKQNLDYFGLLEMLETCSMADLPASYLSNVLLSNGEIDYFSAYGSMIEERVVNRQTVGRSHGVSIRLMKGVSYRVGQSRGQIISETGMVPISHGEFVITNQRLIFNGDKKSVNAPYAKLQNLEMFVDGLRFSLTNRQKPVTIQLRSQQATELAGMYISRILNG